MLKLIIKILLFTLLSQGLYAGDGLSQKHLVSVSPEALAIDVSTDTTIEVVFDTAIVAKSVKKNTIKLNNIKGTTTLVGENTLRFTPNEALKSGKYEVKVKKVKLQTTQSDNTELKPKNAFQKFIYWLCSLFYDNPADCPLCKKICENSSIKTKKITYTFTVDDNSPKIETIALSETSIELHEGNETTLTATANYDDNTTQDISNNVEWVIGDASMVSVSNGTVKALKEGTTTVQAKYESKTSDTLNIIVYKEVNGYILPPEPDPDLNNDTLLGIDNNNNGVRDDVERYIITRYAQDPKYPKTKTAIALQYAWASQKILENPTMESKKYLDDALDCQYYWVNKETDKYTQGMSGFEKGKYRRGLKLLTDPALKDKVYNTRARISQKFSFNASLSGNIFDGRDESIDNCRTNIDEIGE